MGITGGEGRLLSYIGLLVEDEGNTLTEVDDEPQDGIISSERVIESSGRNRGVGDICDRLSSELLNDDANDVLRVVLVDETYLPSPSSSRLERLVDTERAKEGVFTSSREADLAIATDGAASSIGGVE